MGAFQKIPMPGGDAFKIGALNLPWISLLTNRVNRDFRVSVGPSFPACKFIQSDENVWLDLSPAFNVISASTPFRLQIINATAAGVAKVRVRLGKIAGFIADSSMIDPSDSPPFFLTLPGVAQWNYVYCKVTVGYSAGVWASSVCEIESATSIPANDATKFYVEIGTVEVEANGTGGWRVKKIPDQSVKGDQWAVRVGDSTATNGTNGRIGS